MEDYFNLYETYLIPISNQMFTNYQHILSPINLIVN